MVSAIAKAGFRPDWLPDEVSAYLEHVERGQSIRAVARSRNQHASTVSRQVRKTEMLRDDPLADAALARLGRALREVRGRTAHVPSVKELLPMTSPDDPNIDAQTLRVLREMLAPHALLVVADNVADAAVVDMPPGQTPVRKMPVPRALAEALVLRGFIEISVARAVVRYRITAAGRTEVMRLTAASESRRANATVNEDADAPAPFAPPRRGKAPKRRTAGAESPLTVLSRRKLPGGAPFLDRADIAAAMRFREDFELARMDPRMTTDWDQILYGRLTGTGGTGGGGAGDMPLRRLDAMRGLERAIRRLGPELAEVTILAVCDELGMEAIEERSGFSARSGKNVLRIALKMLSRHYAAIGPDGHDLIG